MKIWLLLGTAAIGTLGCDRERIGSPPPGSVSRTDGGSVEAGTGGWQTSTVDSEVDGSAQLSLLVDPAGMPHIAYSAYESFVAGSLRYAWTRGAGSQWERVDQNGRGRNKTWVPGSTVLRLVYDDIAYRGSNFQAVRDSSGLWTVDINDVVDNSAGVSALWRDDRLIRAYLTAVRGVEYPGYEPFMVFRQGVIVDDVPLPIEWTKLTTEAVIPLLSIAADSSGTLHVLYTAPVDDFTQYLPGGDEAVAYTVRYAKVEGGVWSAPEALAPAAGYYQGLAIAVDDNDNVHATFATLGSFEDPESNLTPAFAIAYLRRAPGANGWERDVIPETDPVWLSRGSFALSQTGEAHWVYCLLRAPQPGPCRGVSHAQWTNGAWRHEEIASGCETVTPTALALGPDDSIHVAYIGCEDELVYAQRAAIAR